MISTYFVANSLILLFFFIVIPATASYYPHPDINELIHIQTPTQSPFIGPQSFNVTGLTTNRIFSDGLCSIPSSSEVSGRIMLFDGDTNGCSPEDMTRNIQYAGCVAFVYISQNIAMWGSWGEAVEEAGAAAYGADGSDVSDIRIPYMSVVPKDIRPVVSAVEEGKVGVTLQVTPDTNPYLEPFNWFIFYRILSWVFLTPWALLNVYLAADTVRRVVLKDGSYSFNSLPQMACTIETFSNLIRFIYVSLGPFFTWNIWTFPVLNILMTSTFPLSFLTSLIIAVYWKVVCQQIESLNSEGLDIRKYRYLILFVFLAEAITTWVGAIMRAVYRPVGILLPINAFFEFLASGFMAGYFVVQGRRLVNILETHVTSMDNHGTNTTSYRSGRTINSGLQGTIAKMSKWIMLSAGFTVLFLVAMVGVGSPLFITRWGLSGFLYLTHVALLGTSSTQIIAFRTQVTHKEPVAGPTRLPMQNVSSRGGFAMKTREFQTVDVVDEENFEEI